jgi:integrase
LTEGSKNLAKVTRQEIASREGTQQASDAKVEIIQHVWWMQKEGYRESTIVGRSKLLRVMAKRGADLLDPESVKGVIAKQTWSEGRKDLAVDAYSCFLRMTGGKWNPPKYTRILKTPFIPAETEIDQLIAATSQRMGTFLLLLKQTGVRPGEALNLKWADLDAVHKTISVTPEKNSNPRIFKLSNDLLERLDRLPKISDRIFGNVDKEHFRHGFSLQRASIAHKLQNPRIRRITFRTLRHWKATIEYHRTKDILHVMSILGHKNIKNTLVYTHLAEELFEGQDEYVSKVAKTEHDACTLIDAGFEYVCDFNGDKLFRKRKC